MPDAAGRLASIAHDFVVCQNQFALECTLGYRSVAGIGPAMVARRGRWAVDGHRFCAVAELCADHNVCMAATSRAAIPTVASSHNGLDCSGMFLGCRSARRCTDRRCHCTSDPTRGRRIDNITAPGTTGLLERAPDRSRNSAHHAPAPHPRRCRSLAVAGQRATSQQAAGRSQAVVDETRGTVRFNRVERRSTKGIGQDSNPRARTTGSAGNNPVQGSVKQSRSKTSHKTAQNIEPNDRLLGD